MIILLVECLKEVLFVFSMTTKLKLSHIGVGVDIENISRFANLNLIKDKILLNKIFTPEELKYCYLGEKAAPHLAVRFAAKESIIKALTSAGLKCPCYHEIEIYNNKFKVPEVRFSKGILNNIKIKVSLSHCQDKAIAFTIILIDNDK